MDEMDFTDNEQHRLHSVRIAKFIVTGVTVSILSIVMGGTYCNVASEHKRGDIYKNALHDCRTILINPQLYGKETLTVKK